MMVIREIMYCKPGKVRPMVEKFTAMSKLMEKSGQAKMRVMTDMAAERYWTVIAEFDVPSLAAFEEMMAGMGKQNDATSKEMDKIMTGYHDLIEHGRREIYKVEG